MKFRKYAAIALAGAMCMSLLAGCGDKKDDTSKDSTTASNAEVTSGESTDASAEEENIKATITVWGPAEDQSPDYGEWLQGRCEAFNKEHPNWDLSFEYGTCSEADAGKTVTQDVSASADVYMFANDQLQTLIDANAISEDARLYSTLFPCNECAKAIIQCGIKEVIYLSDKYASTDSTMASKRMFDMAGVTYRPYEVKGKKITIDL